MIRQETLNCVERGLLFVRVRDELRMTLAAYETLYESGVAFGIRKSLMSEKGKVDIIDKVKLFFPIYTHVNQCRKIIILPNFVFRHLK